jgi:subtilisin family serine protease
VLLLLSPGGVPASPTATRIVVGYTAEGYSSAPALERELGAEVIGRIGALRTDVLRLEGGEPDGALALLRADPRVRYAELDGIVRASRVPNDEYLPTQWSVTKTHAEQAWDVSTGSAQVVVGILDTGVDPSQPDLGGKLVAGYDYVNNDQDPERRQRPRHRRRRCRRRKLGQRDRRRRLLLGLPADAGQGARRRRDRVCVRPRAGDRLGDRPRRPRDQREPGLAGQ